MPLKHVPGVRVQASTGNIMIFAWYATGREACWWHNPLASAHIVMALVFKWWENSKIAVTFVEAQAGRTCLKTRHPAGEP